MTTTIPKSAMEQHIAVLGKTGAGKTYRLRGIVERLLDEEKRVCVLDPKGDWYGLRLGADGKSAGYPALIFGGEHADVPINDRSGATVGELVATGNRPCVIDLSAMTIGERTRFFMDFAAALFRHNKGPLWLVIDEVHNFAPQGKVLDPDAGKMLHWANRLASEGRGKGLRLIMASQRPQKVHKDTLTCAETLVAMRVVHNLDRAAIKEWTDGAGDPETSKRILAELGQMPRGDAWVWYPEGRFLERNSSPKIKTYDSMKSPELGSDARLKGWADVDLDDVRTRLAEVVKEAEANDPKKLRQKIAELEKAAKEKAHAPSDPAAIEKAVNAARLETERHWMGQLREMEKVLGIYTGRLDKIAALAHLNGQTPKLPTFTPAPMPRVAPSRPAPRAAPVAIEGEWSQPQRQLLDAFAWFAAIGIDSPSKQQLCFRCGWSPSSSHISNVLGSLRTAGAVNGMRLVAAVPAPELGTLDDYHNQIRGILDQPRRELFNHLLSIYPRESSKEDACGALGWSESSSHISNVVGSLRTYGLVEPRGWKLSEMVFPEGVPA